jgi:plasmid stabilization system protein ParE
MTFSFYPDAEVEFLEAIQFLDERQDGLGLEFAREVYSTIQRILYSPNSWPIYFGNNRRCFAHRFPYSIIYRVEDDHIIVWAVAHHAREPGYWTDRLN